MIEPDCVALDCLLSVTVTHVDADAVGERVAGGKEGVSTIDQLCAMVIEVVEEAAAENEAVCDTDVENVGEFVAETVPVAESDRV